MKKSNGVVSVILILMMAAFAWDGDIAWTIYVGFLLMFNISLRGRNK